MKRHLHLAAASLTATATTTVLCIFAFANYPGGTAFASTAHAPADLFFCDLARASAINGAPNLTSRIAIAVAFVTAVAALVLHVLARWPELPDGRRRPAATLIAMVSMSATLVLASAADEDPSRMHVLGIGLLACSGLPVLVEGLRRARASWTKLFFGGTTVVAAGFCFVVYGLVQLELMALPRALPWGQKVAGLALAAWLIVENRALLIPSAAEVGLRPD
ncbi:MAG: hypothetical protein AAGA56_08640 [Myxococcota bacterium]